MAVQAEHVLALLAELEQAERDLEAEKTRGIDHAVYEMVCEERDVLEARLAKADKLAEKAKAWCDHYEAGKLPAGSLANQERWMAEEKPLAEALCAALAEWEQQ